jgi:hypothetical protein
VCSVVGGARTLILGQVGSGCRCAGAGMGREGTKVRDYEFCQVLSIAFAFDSGGNDSDCNSKGRFSAR